MNALDFSNRIALVTGAGSGIGRASALAYAARGATVVVSDIDETGGRETVDFGAALAGELHFVRADVRDPSEVDALVAGCVRSFGRLDFAHNNAGIPGEVLAVADQDERTWGEVIDINLNGIWRCMRREIPQMLAQGTGSIVNTASIYGLVAAPGMPAYIASKHAVIGLTKAAALDYAATGLRINCVCPGVIDTPAIRARVAAVPELEQIFVDAEPIGRIGRPVEIAEAVMWLSSDASSFVTGIAMPVDGGLSLP